MSPRLSRGAPAVIGATVLGVALSSCASGNPEPAGPASDHETEAPDVTYRDGEYTATGWYGSLPSYQNVTIRLRDGRVEDVQITTPAEDPTSLEHQQRFADALPAAIVGRSIDTLRIDRLAGASGCSEGFMNALASIRRDAATN